VDYESPPSVPKLVVGCEISGIVGQDPPRNFGFGHPRETVRECARDVGQGAQAAEKLVDGPNRTGLIDRFLFLQPGYSHVERVLSVKVWRE